LLGLGVVLGFGAVGANMFDHWGVGLGCSVALLASLQRFYFPVRCEIDRSQARVQTLLGARTMPLDTVRRVSQDGKAILLSSRSTPSSLDLIRGLMLPLPAKGSDLVVREVLERIRRGTGSDR
jgi:hypothetical protein